VHRSETSIQTNLTETEVADWINLFLNQAQCQAAVNIDNIWAL
jgi:hypothetical protein